MARKSLSMGISRRQPAIRRLSWPLFTKAKKSGRQARHVHLDFFGLIKLDLSLRQFRTNKASRSKLARQIVVPIYFLPIKEVAITVLGHKQRRNYPLLTPSNLRRHAQLAAFIPIILGISGAIYFGPHINSPAKLDLKNKNAGQVLSAKATAPKPYTLPHSVPTQVRVAKIGLSAPVVTTGQSPDGSIQVPTSIQETGWYTKSPSPGELGPSVIVGHVDRYDGIGVFWHLRELQPGDIIEIDRADSVTAKFKVDATRQYSQANFPTQEVYGDISYAGLRLITCGGEFDYKTRHYKDNIVVFASLIP